MPDDEQATNSTPLNEQPAIDPLANAAAAAENGYDLDLDLLQPQDKHVKLNGKVYVVHPPRVKDIANLARIAGQLKNNSNTDDIAAKITEMVSAFGYIMPGIVEDELELNTKQLLALFSFVTTMVDPVDNSALKDMGINPTSQKKAQAV